MSAKPVLTCLHGFTGSGADWDGLRDAPGTQQYTIDTPDIRGHGSADVPSDYQLYTMRNVAETITSTWQDPRHLLGYSMGGRLALYIAVTYPKLVKSLILESASPGLRERDARASRKANDNALAAQIESKGIDWFADKWAALSLWDSQTDDMKAELTQRRRQNDPTGLANSLRGMGTGVMPNLWDKLQTCPMPVQLIAGELDTKFVAINHEMAPLFKNATLAIVPSVGHTVHLEAPQTFHKIVDNFLNQQN